MADIFISYSQEDRERVRPIAAALKDKGWRVWWDTEGAAGLLLEEMVEQELAAAKCVVVVWSKSSVKSDWVIGEADEARKRRVLAPIAIDDALPPLRFRRFNTVFLKSVADLPSSIEFHRLVLGVQTHLVGDSELTAEKSEQGLPQEVAETNKQIQKSDQLPELVTDTKKAKPTESGSESLRQDDLDASHESVGYEKLWRLLRTSIVLSAVVFVVVYLLERFFGTNELTGGIPSLFVGLPLLLILGITISLKSSRNHFKTGVYGGILVPLFSLMCAIGITALETEVIRYKLGHDFWPVYTLGTWLFSVLLGMSYLFLFSALRGQFPENVTNASITRLLATGSILAALFWILSGLSISFGMLELFSYISAVGFVGLFFIGVIIGVGSWRIAFRAGYVVGFLVVGLASILSKIAYLLLILKSAQRYPPGTFNHAFYLIVLLSYLTLWLILRSRKSG